MEPKIIHEDNSIIVCIKPPKYPVQSDKTIDYDLHSYVVDYMKKKGFEEPYVGLIHRIDRPVGGLVVLGKNKKSTSDISKQLQDRSFKKAYYAVVNGKPTENKRLIDFLKKNGRTNMSQIVDENTSNAKKAILSYTVIETITVNNEDLSLIKINLETGRHHQIRVQLANDGYPIWGDSKYNDNFSSKKGWFQIALWAYSLTFKHPKTKRNVTYANPPLNVEPFNLFKI